MFIQNMSLKTGLIIHCFYYLCLKLKDDGSNDDINCYEKFVNVSVK